MLGQDLDTGAGVRVVQGLESQVRQRDVPLALVLLMATAEGGSVRMEGSRNTEGEYETQLVKEGYNKSSLFFSHQDTKL